MKLRVVPVQDEVVASSQSRGLVRAKVVEVVGLAGERSLDMADDALGDPGHISRDTTEGVLPSLFVAAGPLLLAALVDLRGVAGEGPDMTAALLPRRRTADGTSIDRRCHT